MLHSLLFHYVMFPYDVAPSDIALLTPLFLRLYYVNVDYYPLPCFVLLIISPSTLVVSRLFTAACRDV